MRMKGYDDIFTVFQIITHVLNLACINMRHGMLNSYRQVDDRLIISSWFPYIQNCVADLKCILRLCSCEALRAVLKLEVTLSLICKLLQKCSTVYCNLQDLFF